MITQFSLYTLADNNLKRNLKKFPFNNVNMNTTDSILKLDSILKSRDVTLPTKISPVKAVVYPVAVYGCESWTMNKAERRRIDAFEPWLEKTLESPLDCKEIQPFHPKGKQS